MSLLSTLLPVGSAGKTFTATASGAIAAKKPVILNSAGTVTEAGMADTVISDDFLAGSQATANIHRWATARPVLGTAQIPINFFLLLNTTIPYTES